MCAMKKSEVTAASTEDLIMELTEMVASSRIFKANQQTANWICQELASRKVINDAASLYERCAAYIPWTCQYRCRSRFLRREAG